MMWLDGRLGSQRCCREIYDDVISRWPKIPEESFRHAGEFIPQRNTAELKAKGRSGAAPARHTKQKSDKAPMLNSADISRIHKVYSYLIEFYTRVSCSHAQILNHYQSNCLLFSTDPQLRIELNSTLARATSELFTWAGLDRALIAECSHGEQARRRWWRRKNRLFKRQRTRMVPDFQFKGGWGVICQNQRRRMVGLGGGDENNR